VSIPTCSLLGVASAFIGQQCRKKCRKVNRTIQNMQKSPCFQHCRCGEMADAQDLKSWDGKTSCGFESHHRHHLQRDPWLTLVAGPVEIRTEESWPCGHLPGHGWSRGKTVTVVKNFAAKCAKVAHLKAGSRRINPHELELTVALARQLPGRVRLWSPVRGIPRARDYVRVRALRLRKQGIRWSRGGRQCR
jgi:hypothetical protein